MRSFTMHIIAAKASAELCNTDVHIADFCEHFNSAYENLEAAKRIAMWRGPLHSYFEVKRDIRRMLDNMQASYHSIIERCYKFYYSAISDDVPCSEDDFIEEVNRIYPFLNKDNRAFMDFCAADLRELTATVKEFNEMERAEKRFDDLCKDTLVQEQTWVRQMKGFPSVEEALSAIDSMEGHQFEHWCAALLRSNNFENVEVTQGSGDQGVDVLAFKGGIKYAIQCKCYNKDLGNTPVQEIYAGKEIYKCHVGAVMTNRGFTAGAMQAAEATGVLLWGRSTIIEMLESMQSPLEIV